MPESLPQAGRPPEHTKTDKAPALLARNSRPRRGSRRSEPAGNGRGAAGGRNVIWSAHAACPSPWTCRCHLSRLWLCLQPHPKPTAAPAPLPCSAAHFPPVSKAVPKLARTTWLRNLKRSHRGPDSLAKASGPRASHSAAHQTFTKRQGTEGEKRRMRPDCPQGPYDLEKE